MNGQMNGFFFSKEYERERVRLNKNDRERERVQFVSERFTHCPKSY